MKLRHREMIAGMILSAPCILGFIIFFVLPYLISLFYCFTKGVSGTEFTGLSNFVSLLKSDSFQLAAVNTIKFNAVCVPIIMILSLTIAFLLNNNLKVSSIYKTSFILPLVIPVASIIIFWQILFDEYGVLNKALLEFGIQPVDWLNSRWSFYILVMLYVWKNCGYNLILFIAGLNNIPVEYYEAARIDGAGRLRCFFKVTIPLLIPTGFFVFIVSFINSFKVFREAYLLAGAYPHSDIYMLQHFMNNNFLNLNYQRLSTAAFLTLMLIVVLVLFMYRYERRYGNEL